jgi:indolepyruvate ferredoxin oxidoreductase alpha subunit
VLLRFLLRLADTRGLVDVAPKKPEKKPKNAPPPPSVAATPLGAYGGEAARSSRVSRLETIRGAVESLLSLNRVEITSNSDLVIVAVGAAWGPTRDALQLIGMEGTVQLVKIGTPYPLPRQMLTGIMRRARRVLVVEELEPFVESRLSDILNKEGIAASVRGKVFISRGGELTTWDVADGLGRFAGLTPPVDDKRIELLDKVVAQVLPARAPALAHGHGMRTAVEAVEKFIVARPGATLIVEAPPEWRVAFAGAKALYFGDWGEGLGVGAAVARRSSEPVAVATEGRGIVAGLSALREAQAEGLPLLSLVSPQGLSASVERALPGAPHHQLDLRALAAGLGLHPSAIVEVGPCDASELARALGEAADLKGGPKILTFEAQSPRRGTP